ncbi:Uncharacterized protein BM_BM9879 [Brugia malayi]|uniref:Bm9879 n=1 Tax=Brugia malayi TaxID=6279 RepID=A0A0K0K0T9_BRUMA|nr:Uncharacterized protein BM_BM9879 [Brugia malayi]CDP95804.1 Bm9879 [Brugia malayi]VIO91042.1 Uncharacterized protein BM_BM9879 [Brugia malayi]
MHVVCAATARSLVMHASSQRMAVVFRMITSSPLFNPITNYGTRFQMPFSVTVAH